MIFWPRETATLLKSDLRCFHREKSTFEKFDAGLKLRIVFYTHETIKTRRKILFSDTSYSILFYICNMYFVFCFFLGGGEGGFSRHFTFGHHGK